ncbi:hypothetical protein GCM10010174_42640 [Kutzneria viridogrisea]|uniref:Aminoglycoside phosphotransferase domain-containing protein n=2 Tax=Kutzneria TaxID=43356 RepID=W5W6D8_9PSEU|nr:hypothetical protein [Kutzneria albida]AHH96066.1 hypothetical protein KALB_2698 [Kutzneria albida DSM 43870]MBA8928727.1 hypothetical protein [Kutzneria viridogrisea]
MSVETTAGPADVNGALDPEVADAVAAAEAVLSRRFGAAVRLADPEDLGGSGKATVLRVRVAATPFSLPRTLVVKRYQPSPVGEAVDPFPHEAVSYQLFTALGQDDRICPELVAHDGAKRLIVLEDLGRAPTLADKLLGHDARGAERSLLAWARSLGRLHATTAGREADFDALTRRLGARPGQDPIALRVQAALSELPALLREVLAVDVREQAVAYARAAGALLTSTKHRAFSPSDACPDNHLVTSKGLRVLDFEGGCVRDVVLDAAALRIPFPLCGCSFRLPAGMTEAMIAAWRAEVSQVFPDLDEDEVLMPRLLEAQLLWVWLSTWLYLPRPGEADRPVTSRLASPRRSSALHARWLRLRDDAGRLQEAHVADHADAVASALEARFGADTVQLPLFPAFS